MADDSNYITRAEHDTYTEYMRSENQRLRDEDDRQNARLKNLEGMMENFRTVQASMEKMEAIMQSTLVEIEKQGKRLERLESRDGEMWRKVVGHITTTVVGLVIGYMFTRLGM